jgi:hypothetical protein
MVVSGLVLFKIMDLHLGLLGEGVQYFSFNFRC